MWREGAEEGEGKVGVVGEGRGEWALRSYGRRFSSIQEFVARVGEGRRLAFRSEILISHRERDNDISDLINGTAFFSHIVKKVFLKVPNGIYRHI